MLPNVIHAEEVGAVLHDWAMALESTSLEGPLRQTVPIWHQGFEGNFMRAEGPDGAAWAPRKDSKPHPLLILYGYLIEAARDTGSPGNITEVGPRDLRTGVDVSVVKYAGFHDTGTSRMPARVYLYAAADVQDLALEAFANAAFTLLVGV